MEESMIMRKQLGAIDLTTLLPVILAVLSLFGVSGC